MNQAVRNHLADASQTCLPGTPPDRPHMDGPVVCQANALTVVWSAGDRYVPVVSSPTIFRNGKSWPGYDIVVHEKSRQI